MQQQVKLLLRGSGSSICDDAEREAEKGGVSPFATPAFGAVIGLSKNSAVA